MKLRVRENEKLVRDSGNLAILNTDPDAITQHERKMIQLQRVKAQEAEINSLKRDISDMKDMLHALMSRESK
jgi:hypothetical protein